ncbi:unnamed protein product, partial [Porites evermanni]
MEMCAFLTYAYNKFHNFFPHTGDGKSFTSLDGLRAHPNKSHLPKRPDCRDCGYKTNDAGHLKHHRDCWHNGTSQKDTCTFVVTPKQPGSLYCPFILGFLHVARRGAFMETAIEAWTTKNFVYKDKAKNWPLFAQVDTSTQTLKNKSLTTIQLSKMVSSSIGKVGLNPKEFSHRSYRS